MDRLGALRRSVLALAMAAALTATLAPPTAALADGDPASDVLATSNLFLPWDAHLSARQQAQAVALLATTRRDGVLVRVAVVASPSDLGSVSQLWLKPHTYAQFLGEELSLVYRGPLVVVMPDGLGVYQAGESLNRGEAAIAASPPPGIHPHALLTAVTSAVRRIAAASGHAIGSVHGTAATARPTGPGIVTWLAVALGVILIAGAWAASLRARPLTLRSHG